MQPEVQSAVVVREYLPEVVRLNRRGLERNHSQPIERRVPARRAASVR